MKFAFYILLFNFLWAIPKKQREEEQKQIQQVINNANAKLRLKFSSDENFRQFRFLQNDDSLENRSLVRKFLVDALKNNTITLEETSIFTNYIDNIHDVKVLEAKRFECDQEKMLQEDKVKHAKIMEEDNLFLKKLSEDIERWELKRLELEEKKKTKKMPNPNTFFGIGLITGVLLIVSIYKFKSKNPNKWRNKKFWICQCAFVWGSLVIYALFVE